MTEKKVWVVSENLFPSEGHILYGIFSTEKKAQLYANEFEEVDLCVYEYPVDEEEDEEEERLMSAIRNGETYPPTFQGPTGGEE